MSIEDNKEKDDLTSELADVLEDSLKVHVDEEENAEQEQETPESEEQVEEDSAQESEDEDAEDDEQETQEESSGESEEASDEADGQEDKATELSEVEQLKKDNEELRVQMEHLSGFAAQIPPKEVQANGEQTQEKVQQTPPKQEAVKFVTEETFDKMLTDADSMNTIITDVFNKASAKAVEDTYRKVPFLVQRLVQQQSTLNSMVTDFYETNKDLVPYKKFVGFVSNEIASEHPDWEYNKLLEETGKTVRKRINLRQVTDSANTKPPNKKPAFAKGSKAKKGSLKQLTELEQDIMELID